MRVSQALIPALKENPAEAAVVSHRLMLRAGLIRQVASGIYSWLPSGLKALRNIETIVREELDAAGAQEILMPTIQPASLWRESGRYDDYGKEMLRIRDRHDADLLYGPTAEEVVTDIFRKNVVTPKKLPLNLYQLSWKFRDEIRPRFGLMRGREFLMKDGYSFDRNKEGAENTYHAMFKAYMGVFARLGLHAVPVKADNGAIGGDLSHEFHVLADTGESEIFYDAEIDRILSGEKTPESVTELMNYYAAADEMHKPEECPLPAEKLSARRGIEVGHIFYFGTKYTEAMGASLTGEDGQPFFPHMGSYGIGVSRLVAAVIEASHDDNGIIWPVSVAPYKIAVINIRPAHEGCTASCENIYNALRAQNISTLYDDTDGSAGKKFAEADLGGTPVQIRIGPKKAEAGQAELYIRATGETRDVALEDAAQEAAAALAGAAPAFVARPAA